MKKKRLSKSGYRGVEKNHKSGWQARICVGSRFNRKRVNLGTYETAKEAAEAYDDAAIEHHGERAILNFPNRSLRVRIRSLDSNSNSPDEPAPQPTEKPGSSERNGDPVIFDSIKQWLLGEENKPVAPIPERQKTPAVQKPDDALTTPPDACECGGTFVEISSGISRCQQCGRQRAVAPRRAAAGVPIITKPSTTPAACPKCNSSLVQQVSNDWRCAQCGAQGVEHRSGISRSEIGTFEGGRAVMNPPTFFVALARLRGR